MDNVLLMLKLDLGITYTAKDEYFSTLLQGCEAELIQKGVTLDLENPEDVMLLSDYAAWRYRKRTEDASIPQNLHYRIRNKIIKGRAYSG